MRFFLSSIVSPSLSMHLQKDKMFKIDCRKETCNMNSTTLVRRDGALNKLCQVKLKTFAYSVGK